MFLKTIHYEYTNLFFKSNLLLIGKHIWVANKTTDVFVVIWELSLGNYGIRFQLESYYILYVNYDLNQHHIG